jgi:hypothetical protein
MLYASNCGTQFHVVSHGCGATLKNGGNCTINVEFVPAADVAVYYQKLFNGRRVFKIVHVDEKSINTLHKMHEDIKREKAEGRNYWDDI